MDTDKLLEKYIRYIIDCEGTDYIAIHDNRGYSEVEFTEEEWQYLKEISKKLND